MLYSYIVTYLILGSLCISINVLWLSVEPPCILNRKYGFLWFYLRWYSLRLPKEPNEMTNRRTYILIWFDCESHWQGSGLRSPMTKFLNCIFKKAFMLSPYFIMVVTNITSWIPLCFMHCWVFDACFLGNFFSQEECYFFCSNLKKFKQTIQVLVL